MPTSRVGYKTTDGTKVPSVTTILKIKDPGALINWAYRTGREHGILEGSGQPAPSGLYDGSDVLAIGTCVHSMCEAWVKGDEPMLVLEKALDAETVYDKASFRARIRPYFRPLVLVFCFASRRQGRGVKPAIIGTLSSPY